MAISRLVKVYRQCVPLSSSEFDPCNRDFVPFCFLPRVDTKKEGSYGAECCNPQGGPGLEIKEMILTSSFE